MKMKKVKPKVEKGADKKGMNPKKARRAVKGKGCGKK